MEALLYGVAAFLPINVLVGLARTIIGPSPRDRLLSFALLGTTRVAVLVVLAAVTGVAALRDAALALVAFAALGVLVGVALAEPHLAEACVLATVLYAVHHGLYKGALFLAVPLWKQHGAGRARIALLLGLAYAALAITGAPLTSGYLAKYAAKGAVDGAQF